MELVSSHIKTLGRPGKPASVEIVRELTVADLALLNGDRGVRPPSLKRITDTHHSIARLIAQGQAGYEIALATGYSQSRISILKSDPAFAELVEFYRADVNRIRDELFIDTQAKLAALRNDSIERLHDKVLEDDCTFAEALDAAKFSSDRSGYGPQSKSTNLNISMDFAEKLAAGRQRALELSAVISPAATTSGAGEGLPMLSPAPDDDSGPTMENSGPTEGSSDPSEEDK